MKNLQLKDEERSMRAVFEYTILKWIEKLHFCQEKIERRHHGHEFTCRFFMDFFLYAFVVFGSKGNCGID